MRVYVVDNGGQWTHREWRVLKYLGVDTKIVPNDSPMSDLQGLDGLVLSGGAPRVGIDPEKMGKNGEYLDAFDGPILGICAGHQFMATHLGGAAAPAKGPQGPPPAARGSQRTPAGPATTSRSRRPSAGPSAPWEGASRSTSRSSPRFATTPDHTS